MTVAGRGPAKLLRIADRLPLALRMVTAGLLLGAMLWFALDLVQGRVLTGIFRAQLSRTLAEIAANDRHRFDRAVHSQSHLAEVLAEHRPLHVYLRKRAAGGAAEEGRRRPSWIPRRSMMRDYVVPDYFLLLDPDGRLLDFHAARNEPPPPGLLAPKLRLLAHAAQETYMAEIDGLPMVLAAAPVTDGGRLATVLVASRLDDRFIAASQGLSQRSGFALAVFAGDPPRVLASTDGAVAKGATLAQLGDDFFVAGQTVFDYGGSELRLQLASLVPHRQATSLIEPIIEVERRHRTLIAMAFTVFFALLLLLVSLRLRRHINTVNAFTERVFGVPQSGFHTGNELANLEAQFEWLGHEVLLGREARRTEEALRRAQAELEDRVEERTRALRLEIDERQQVEQRLRQRERIMEATADAARRLFAAADWRDCIEEVLTGLGQAADVCRVHLFQNHHDETGRRMTRRLHQWTARDLPGECAIAAGADLFELGLRRWTEELGAGRVICGEVRGLPENERRLLDRQGIRALLIVPLFVDRLWWGFVGFDECSADRSFAPSEVEALQTAAGIIGTAIQRQSAEEASHRSEATLTALHAITASPAPLADKIDALLGLGCAHFELAVGIFGEVSGDSYRVVAARSPEGDPDGGIVPGSSCPLGPICRATMEADEPMVFETASEVPGSAAAGAYLGAAISVDGRKFGTIGFWDVARRPRRFPSADREILKLMAQWLGGELGRVRAQEALRNSEAKYRTVIDEASDAILLAQPQGRLVDANIKAEEMLGLPKADIIGLSLYEIFPGKAQGRVRRALGRLGGRTSARVADVMVERRGGRPVPVDITATAVRIGEETLWQAIFHDITHSKQVEAALLAAKEQAELANRAKSEFLASVSHELRTPLNAIIGFSDIMAGQMFGHLGNHHYEEYAANINESGRHLLEIINDILDVSKIEAGKLELHEEPVSLVRATEAAARLIRDRAERGQVGLILALPQDLPAMLADERRIKQILLNLLSNAVKFTPPGGRIVVRGEAEVAGGVAITVADSGIGMSQRDIRKAMSAFGQVDSRLARKYEGTGLGLSLSKGLAESHGGSLTVKSRPGEGTTVTVWLPAARVIAAEAAEAALD